MYPFRYSVSLRVWHPNADPRRISEGLGLQPNTSHRAGEAKRTPAGDLLKGVYKQTYWCCELEHPEEVELNAFLEEVTDRLAPHEGFVKQICTTDGTVELFVGWYSGSNSGQEFGWQLLRKLGDLRVRLSLDIYSDEKNASVARKRSTRQPHVN